MKFYIFKHSSGRDIGKKYPQVQETHLPKGKTVHDLNFIWNVEFCALPNFIPFLGEIRLIKGAKITDLISVSYVSNGYIISEELFSLLEAHQTGDSINVPVTVNKDDLCFEYKWIHFANNQSQNIDFEQTEIVLKDTFGEIESVLVNTYEELVELRKKTSSLKKIETKNLTIKIEPSIDCFYLKELSLGLIISERLGQKIIQENFDGISLCQIEINIK